MAKSVKVKAKAKRFACQSKSQASESISLIGNAQREITTLETEVTEITANALDERKDRINELQDVIEIHTQGVQIWSEANRDELCKDGKTANLVTGEVSWRVRPPSVSLSKVATVLECLRKAGLTRFIRTQETVNKDAILDSPDVVKNIKGISVKTGIEDFSITPFEIEFGE